MSKPDAPRAAIPILSLLPPEQMPRGRHAFRAIEPRVREAVLAACGGAETLPDSEALVRVRAALDIARVSSVPAGGQLHEPGTFADEAAHDEYCRIARVTGDAPRISLCGTLQAYGELLIEGMEAGTSMAGRDWLELRSALESILSYALAEPLREPPEIDLAAPASSGHLDPVRRWILGHHIFLVIIQGLILATHDLENALTEGRQPDAAAAFGQGSLLFDACALAFRFATDFSPDHYQNVVRSTMMPPVAPAGLSGLLSADHRHLVRTLAALRPRLEALESDLRPSYQAFRGAFETAYEAHKLVCGRFSGHTIPSLLMRQDSEMSAVEQLDQFKCTRMRMLP